MMADIMHVDVIREQRNGHPWVTASPLSLGNGFAVIAGGASPTVQLHRQLRRASRDDREWKQAGVVRGARVSGAIAPPTPRSTAKPLRRDYGKAVTQG